MAEKAQKPLDKNKRPPISVEMSDKEAATQCFAPVVERWCSLNRRNEGLPNCRDFQQDNLEDFPSRVSVMEPIDGGRDFRFVIYAGAIIEAGGVDMTGYCLSDLHVEALRDAMIRNVQLVMTKKTTGIWRYRHGWKESTFDYCCLYLPLQYGDEDGIRIHSVIVNTDPSRRQMYKGRFEKTRHAVKPDQFKHQ